MNHPNSILGNPYVPPKGLEKHYEDCMKGQLEEQFKRFLLSRTSAAISFNHKPEQTSGKFPCK